MGLAKRIIKQGAHLKPLDYYPAHIGTHYTINFFIPAIALVSQKYGSKADHKLRVI